VGIGTLDRTEVFAATMGRYPPGHVALIKLGDPQRRVAVAIVDSDSEAGYPIDVSDEGISEAELPGYVSGWSPLGVDDRRYRDALHLRRFQNATPG